MSNFYEEKATMIAAGDLQEFVPFGRDHCKQHPNALTLQLRQLQPASELWSSDGAAGLVGSLQEVTIHEKQKVLFSFPACFLKLRGIGSLWCKTLHMQLREQYGALSGVKVEVRQFPSVLR